MFEEIFNKKTVNTEKLSDYGFIKDGGGYIFNADLPEEGFTLTVTFDGEFDTSLTDDLGEDYTLYKTDAEGAFVGRIRNLVRERLEDIAKNCCDGWVFSNPHTLAAIDYAAKKYGDALEFLWPDTPDNAVLRRNDSSKWYAAILCAPAKRFNKEGKTALEILDLKAPPDFVAKIIDNKTFFPAWHMNKKHWFTVLLSGDIRDEYLFGLIDQSYSLAGR